MHVVTLIAQPGSVLAVESFVTALGKPENLIWLEADRACDLYYRTPPQRVQSLAFQQKTDAIVQPVAGREKKLLIADMDSTMIAQECIDELADCVGLKPHVAAITERAMRGELDFPAALRQRVALLKGLEESALQKVFDERITPTPGARTLIATLKARGAYTLLVSGGFKFFTSRVARTIGFHADESNFLETENGKLSGLVREPILDKNSKREALLRVAKERKIALKETLAIGDGANDIPMLNEAGLGIAYHAKPKVVEAAAAAIHYNDLSAVLFALGIPRREWATSQAP